MWQRSTHAWDSPALLGRTMELVVHGHAGARLLAFPTSMGWNREWEDRGMCDAVADQLAAGDLQIICVPSVDAQAWYDDHAHPRARAEWHARYDVYLRDEVLPFTAEANPNPFVITAGASFGGYHALCFAARYPELVGRALVMSALVDIRRLTGGWSDDVIYFYNPAEFMVHEHDPERIRRLQALDLILAVGTDDTLRAQNELLAGQLWQRGIGNALRLWDGWAHDWPWWRDMLRRYVGGHD
ncbi:MAG: esterase [Gemmatimonadetes bacterium]|nr:esterase [Gemmatimonadota bacterium]MCB9518079.1 esterase [Gemmatimonadales bacterium]HPF62862.1 alpha/beta hydrolase-fold protein [Gemmatimonadales bacterium]HRX17420.1 alpha/beta hydrolase-fold protein [Gemmatimonadales bacterium]